MIDHIDELKDTLNQELETFNRFLVLLDEQHRRIAKNDIDGLEKISADLDLLSNQAADLERQRQAVTKNISGSINLENPNPTLSELLARLEGISPDGLIDLRQAIIDVHEKIVEKSTRNKFLIDKSRFLIAESMKILSSRPAPTYARPRPENMAAADRNLINRSA
jgi:flagellar biosynthesis/type III secretory pathway chaperone